MKSNGFLRRVALYLSRRHNRLTEIDADLPTQVYSLKTVPMPAFNVERLHRPGCTIDMIPDDYDTYEAKIENERGLLELGITLSGTHLGQGNTISIHRGSTRPRKVKVTLRGASNAIYLGLNDALAGSIEFWQDGNVFATGGNPATPDAVRMDVRLTGANGTFLWGANSTSNGVQIITAGEASSIVVGDDCMFASGIWIRSSDMHAMIDLPTGKIANPPRDVHVGKHVWVGQDALILKNSEIGGGSIIAARALTQAPFQPASLLLGSPARVARSGVSWTRSPAPTQSQIDHLRKEFGA